MVNIILSGVDNSQADLNQDGLIDIVDIVMLVNLILGEEYLGEE